MKHSKIGASSCERYWNCPGSIKLCEGIPEETSPYAQEGTDAHNLAQFCLEVRKNPESCIGQKFATFVPDREMAEAVEVYYDTVTNDLDKYYTAGVPMDALLIEQKFHLTDVDEDAFGTCDACFIQPFEKIVVYDYKHGKGIPVEAKDNKQMMFYALGALSLCKSEIQEIEMVIVQPRCNHPDGPVRRWTISIEQLMEFAGKLQMAIAQTREKNAKLCLGDWCKFCPARKNGCPLIQKQVMKTAQQDFAPVVDQGWHLKPVAEMSPVEIKNILDNATLIMDWVKGVMSHAHLQAEGGKEIPGYKLVQRRSTRKWVDEERAFSELNKKYKLTDLYDMKFKSPTQMEKVIPKKELKDMIMKYDNGTALVPEGDKRQAVKSSVEADFKPQIPDLFQL